MTGEECLGRHWYGFGPIRLDWGKYKDSKDRDIYINNNLLLLKS